MTTNHPDEYHSGGLTSQIAMCCGPGIKKKLSPGHKIPPRCRFESVRSVRPLSHPSYEISSCISMQLSACRLCSQLYCIAMLLFLMLAILLSLPSLGVTRILTSIVGLGKEVMEGYDSRLAVLASRKRLILLFSRALFRLLYVVAYPVAFQNPTSWNNTSHSNLFGVLFTGLSSISLNSRIYTISLRIVFYSVEF